ncbi:sulfotransferase family protein [Dyella mobilis]|uniref:Sulfotransferase n=1 Tax=Dyella mobilis TaxID=1849582 RepID=A0ABS2KMJ4_9GAMM|nr:sulfotransferase [Dyella mobilis]MBM7132341.1 sulfotransferase [Dyella mobilis]GLQ95671.1 hypothetical protein GCM10007863_00890 [Dyella mobilis]
MWKFKRPGDARPVFVIGSYRSATSALTWALGQHPNIFPIEETHFLYKLAVDLEYLYEIGAGQGPRSFLGSADYTRRHFRNHFGNACNALILGSRKRIVERSYAEALKNRQAHSPNIKLHRGWWQPKRRWIDGTPENSHYVLPLLRLFPHARFIHILRNPRSVATSLMHFSTMGAHDYTEKDAYETWSRLAYACALSEQALGATRIMRVLHEELVDAPQSTLARCLQFIGEKYRDDCLKPLKDKINSSRYDSAGDCSIAANIQSDAPWIRSAYELYKRLLEGRGAIDGNAAMARHELWHTTNEYSESLLPATNERLSKANNELERSTLELQCQLKRLSRPLTILDWGPQDIQAGASFNPQEDGSNAVWIKTLNAPWDTEVILDGVVLPTATHADGELVTANVPAFLTAAPRSLELVLRSQFYGEATASIYALILPSPIRDEEFPDPHSTPLVDEPSSDIASNIL